MEGDELAAIWQEQRQDMSPIAGTLSLVGQSCYLMTTAQLNRIPTRLTSR